jgi:hypothetical protein
MFADWGVLVAVDGCSSPSVRGEVSVVHEEAIKTGAHATWASLSRFLSQSAAKRRVVGLDEKGAWEKHQSSTSPPPPPPTGRDYERKHAPASGPNQRPADLRLTRREKRPGCVVLSTQSTFVKPLTTRPASSSLHSTISTNMRGLESPLSP